MEVAGLQQLLADGLASSALKEHIIRHYYRPLAGGFHQGVDVLEEVELLIGAGGPEVLPVVDQILFLLFSLLVGEGQGRLFAKGRVCEHIVKPLTGVGEQGVPQSDGYLTVEVADVVDVEIHQAHLEGGGHNLPAPESLFLQKLLFLPVQIVVLRVAQIALSR